MNIAVINGPNLNLLGEREPHIYGKGTLGDLENLSQEVAKTVGATLVFRQSNHEGELVDWVQEARRQAQAVVINAGGYTHTSVSIRDAVSAVSVPVIEVHISNIFARDGFRHLSHIAPVARASLCGFGISGYALAIDGLAALIGAAQQG